MADRKLLKTELDRVNTMAAEVELNLKKKGATPDQIRQARNIANDKRSRLVDELGDDLQKMNQGKSIKIKGGTISPELSQKNMPDMAKQSGLGKEGIFDSLKKKLDIPVEAPKAITPDAVISSDDQLIEKLKKAGFDVDAPPKPSTITSQADDAYKAAKNLKGLKSGGKFGLLLGALGVGTGLLSPGSASAKAINTVGELADSTLPISHLGKPLQEALDSDVLEKEIARLRAKKEAQSIVKPMIKELGGEPDMNPKRALASTGELASGESEDRGNEEKLFNMREQEEMEKRRRYNDGRNSGKGE
jgi:hypothetical protein